MANFTRDRGYTRARRMGRDEEEGREELRQMIDDPDISAGELIAALVEHCPEEQREELNDSLRQMHGDSRGHRSWARDKLERRRFGRDMRQRGGRQYGRDFGSENLTDNTGPIEEFGSERSREWEDRGAGGEDRRHHGAMDSRMAMDGRDPLSRLFAGARRVERI